MRTPVLDCLALGKVGIIALALMAAGCSQPTLSNTADDRRERFWTMKRKEMVKRQIQNRGVKDPAVLAAIEKVERHRFVPLAHRAHSYEDRPLYIGEGQTISQPYIVGLMTQLLEPQPGDKVLEIGTGSGYQAAVLAEIVGEVYTIEIVESLGRGAEALLDELGYDNVHVRVGDGYQGWPEHAPFDSVIVTAAPDHVPQPLVDQLKVGGRLVLPVGPTYSQRLQVIEKTDTGTKIHNDIAVRFVPMTGEAQDEQR